MASSYDWQRTVIHVRDLWGRHNAASWDKAEHAYRKRPQIQAIPYEALDEAVNDFLAEGLQWAPSISKVLARASAGRDVSVVPTQDECRHPTTADLGDEIRCAVCGKVWEVTA